MFPHQPELTLPTVAALTLALVVSNAAALAYAWVTGSRFGADRSARANESVEPVRTGAEVDPDQLRIRCPDCEATNDPGYRYCRECVSELPGGADFSRTAPPSFGRFVR